MVAGEVAGALVKMFVMATEQMRTPPPPLATPLHCATWFTTSAEVVAVVTQVPPPDAIGPAAPAQRVTEISDGCVGAPAISTKLVMFTVQLRPCPPTLLAESSLHCVTGDAAAIAGVAEPPSAPAAVRSIPTAKMVSVSRMARCEREDVDADLLSQPGSSDCRFEMRDHDSE